MNPENDKTPPLISFRHVWLSLVCGTAWLIGLAATGYPVPEWPSAAAIGCATFLTIGIVTINIARFALRRLLAYSDTLLAMMGATPPADAPSPRRTHQIRALMFVVAIAAAVIGTSVVATCLIAPSFEMPALPSGILASGVIAAAVGWTVSLLHLAYLYGGLALLARRYQRLTLEIEGVESPDGEAVADRDPRLEQQIARLHGIVTTMPSMMTTRARG